MIPGYGFDNIGDALSVSPLLMEKYLNAAGAIVAKAVPGEGREQRQASPRQLSTFFRDGPAPEDAAEARCLCARDSRRVCTPRVSPAGGRSDGRSAGRVAKETYSAPGQTFEAGVGGAMVAVLSSPRFLFRVEEVAAKSAERAISARG